MGKIKIFIVIAVVFSMIVLFSAAASAEKRIGILTFSEEVRYNDTQRGIMDQLNKDGFGEPAVKFTIENAKGSKAKAAELVQKFVAAKMDLIITIGTTATIAVTREIKNVPVVFGMVYDPIEAGIAKDWKSSGNNTTGVSPKVAMSKLVSSLKELAPVKKLAVLYTPGEKNTEIQLKELQELQSSLQIKVIPIIMAKKEEVARTLSAVVHTVDAFYLTGSGVVGTTVPIIVAIANQAHVVTITHLDDLVEKGALLGICANSNLVGHLAGKKAVQILKGAKPSSIPIEIEKKLDFILNMKTAKAGQFQVPLSFMKKVTRTIE
ncbi:MAG TPA: ABC transporter substrate-binding protein [Nitrospirota bacterium]|nr:ABC transporter substrate-binding protein [Nitrospirota bacterium]